MWLKKGRQTKYDELQNQHFEGKFTNLDSKVGSLSEKVEQNSSNLEEINSHVQKLNDNTFIAWTNNITVGRVLRWIGSGIVLLVTSDVFSGVLKSTLLQYFNIKIDPSSIEKVQENPNFTLSSEQKQIIEQQEQIIKLQQRIIDSEK